MRKSYVRFLWLVTFFMASLYGQDRVIGLYVSKPSPASGKPFTEYQAGFRGGLKFYQFWQDNYVYGGGIESLDFRKADLPSRTLKLINIFALGGYQFDLDGKVRILTSIHAGVSNMDFGFEKSSDVSPSAKATDRIAFLAGSSISAIIPFSSQLIIEPELGFVSIFHKLDGYQLKDTKGQILKEKAIAPLGIWIFRFGLGYRF